MRRAAMTICLLWLAWAAAAINVQAGQTDVTTYWVLRDSTTHEPTAAVSAPDIDLYYTPQGQARSAKYDAVALLSADAAHTDHGAYSLGGGLYRVDWPDAAFAGAAGTVVILEVRATGVDTAYLELELSPPVGVASSVSGAVGSVTAPVTAGTVTDKTGYSLATPPPTVAQIRAEIDANSTQFAGIRAKTDLIPAQPVAVSDLPEVAHLATSTEVEAVGSLVQSVLDDLGGMATAEEVAVAVWGAQADAHNATGTTGALLAVAAQGGDGADAAAIAEAVDSLLSLRHGSGPWGGAAGTGSKLVIYPVRDSAGLPVADALVEVSTDANKAHVVATGRTNLFGLVPLLLDPGEYRFWVRKAGVGFSNPYTETVPE